MIQVTCLEDHLSGFDNNYQNAALLHIADQSVYTEYLLPDEIKLQYRANVYFSAWLMIKNNSLTQFLKLAKPVTGNRTNFLCSFNKTGDPYRKKFIMALIAAGLFDAKYCSRNFDINDNDWLVFFKTLPGYVLDPNINLQQVGRQLHEITCFSQELVNGQIQEMNLSFAPKILDSFITAVCEPVSQSYVPFPTEKFCFPIVNKSLWLSYAQPGYHKFLHEKFGIQRYQGINYGFDEEPDPAKRLVLYIDELLRLKKLSQDEKVEIYQSNQSRIDQNFDIVTSGRMIYNIWQHDEMSKHVELHDIDSDKQDLYKQLWALSKFLGQ